MSQITEMFTGPDSGAQSRAATKANKRQQGAIDYGLQQLNAIYGGGTYNQYAQAGGSYNPATQYYTDKNGTYTPFQTGGTPVAGGSGMVGHHGKGGLGGSGIGLEGTSGFLGDPVGMGFMMGGLLGSPHTPKAYSLMKKGKLFTASPSQQFAGYKDDFFNQRARAYEDYALPQLGQQYQTTKNAVNFNLANRGLLGGSVAGQENNDLNFTMGQQKQAIADQGQQQAQQLRSDVQNSKLQAISQLYQTANPAQAQASALADASKFTAPSSFAPLANGFANLVNQYSMNQQIAGYQQQPGGYSGGGGYGGQYTSPQAGALPENR